MNQIQLFYISLLTAATQLCFGGCLGQIIYIYIYIKKSADADGGWPFV